MFPGPNNYPGTNSYPGIYSSTGAVVIPAGYRLYRTPTFQAQPANPRGERLWLYFGTTQGISVLRNGTTYTAVINPTDLEAEEADFFYQGGHEYIVTEAEYEALTSADLSLFPPVVTPPIDTPPPPPVQVSGYGSGAYGSGPYGV